MSMTYDGSVIQCVPFWGTLPETLKSSSLRTFLRSILKIKYVRDVTALREMEKVYLTRGLRVIWVNNETRIEAYDKKDGKLKAIAEVREK